MPWHMQLDLERRQLESASQLTSRDVLTGFVKNIFADSKQQPRETNIDFAKMLNIEKGEVALADPKTRDLSKSQLSELKKIKKDMRNQGNGSSPSTVGGTIPQSPSHRRKPNDGSRGKGLHESRDSGKKGEKGKGKGKGKDKSKGKGKGKGKMN